MHLPPLHRLAVAPLGGLDVGAPDGVPSDGSAKFRRVERQSTELASLVSRIKGGVTGVGRVALLREAKQVYRAMVKLSAVVMLDDDVQELVNYINAEWARSIEFALEGVSTMSEVTLSQAGELREFIDALLEDASVLSQEELESLARARADLDATRLRIVLEMDTQPEQQDDDANSSSVTNEASSATEPPSSATETPSSATETPSSAADTPSSATETPSSATETPPSATETPSSATETPSSATETHSSVINEVEDGDALDEGGGGGGGDDQVEFAELSDSADDDDDYDSLGRIAGRAAMKFRGKKLEYFLAVWTGYDIAETAEWLKESEFDTPRRKALLVAYKLRTGGDDDPQDRGWVRRVMEERQRGRGRGKYTEYKVEWLMDNDVPKLERLFDWVRRSELVSPAAVLGGDAAGRVDGAGAAAGDDEGADPSEFDSDGEEDGEENAAGRRTRRGALPPEAGTEDDAEMLTGDSSNALVWDAGSQRAKVSIARTIATLEKEGPWLVLALEEWCNWRLYLLMCSVPREASVSSADWKTLGRDLYAIDRDRLDALNDEADSGKSPEEHEQEQTEMLLQRVDTAWRRRRARRERDVSLIRGQLRGLKLLRLRRAGRSDAAASQVQVDSMDDDQIRADLQLDDGEQDAKIVADSQRIADAADAGEAWWAEFASPPARMHAQGNLLAGSREVGGVRNVAQKSYLGWLRSTMTEKEERLRVRTRLVNGRQRYEYSDEWMNLTWGSPYSSFWPKGKRATPTTTSLEHIVPSEWLRSGEIVKECGYPRQDATICCLANQSENSARNDKPLSVFGVDSDRNNQRLYSPPIPETNVAKPALLAKATAHGILCYPFVQQETKSAGSKLFSSGFGVAEYSRRLSGLTRFSLQDPTAWERRVAMVNAARHKWHNPLALRPTLLRNPRFSQLLDMRLRGGRSESGELTCGLALLVDSQLRGLVDGPV